MKRTKKQNKNERYSVMIYCRNCNKNIMYEILKGMPVEDFIPITVCSYCGLPLGIWEEK